jgi:hypothetical protein
MEAKPKTISAPGAQIVDEARELLRPFAKRHTKLCGTDVHQTHERAQIGDDDGQGKGFRSQKWMNF